MPKNLDYVHIESSTYCNAKCKFCPHSQIKRHGMMKYKMFTNIIDQAMDLGCKAFTIFRVGEPLLFPHLFDWLDYIRLKKANVSIYTNGSNLTPEIGKRLKEYSDIYCDFTISFHGCDQESYEYNMGISFDKVYNRILDFMKDNPIKVNIYSLVNDIKDKVIREKFYGLWNGIGFSGVGLSRYMEWAGSITGFSTIRTELIAGKLKVEIVPCHRILHELDIMYDGTVCLCCVDAFGDIIFGNINDLSMKEILNHKLRQYYQEKHMIGESEELPLCKHCSTKMEVIRESKNPGNTRLDE